MAGVDRVFLACKVVDEGDEVVQHTLHVLFGCGVIDDLAVSVQVVVPCLIGGGDTRFKAIQVGKQTLVQIILAAFIEIDYGIARDMLELKIRLGSKQLAPKQFVRTRPLHGFVLGRGIRRAVSELDHGNHPNARRDHQQERHGNDQPLLTLHGCRPPWFRTQPCCPRPRLRDFSSFPPRR